MELFGQGLHKFVLAGQLAGVNLRTVQGRKILLPIEAARKIVSMLQRPEFDAPVFAGIQALHAAAIVAHLGQNTVMRLRNIGGAADFQNVSGAIRYRQIQMDRVSSESALRPHTPAFFGIVHKILYFSIRIGGKGVFGACEPITIRCAALAILLYTPVCGYLIVRILLPTFPILGDGAPGFLHGKGNIGTVKLFAVLPKLRRKRSILAFQRLQRHVQTGAVIPNQTGVFAVCHMLGQTL